MARKIISDSADPVPTCYGYSALFFGLVGTLASAASVLTIIAGIFAAWRLFISRSLTHIEIPGLNLVWMAVFAFYGAGVLSAAIYPSDSESVKQLIERLPLLFLPLLIIFFAQAAEPMKLMRWSVIGAMVGIVILTAYWGFTWVYSATRFEGLSGNANVFGYMCGFLVIWLALGLRLIKNNWVKIACLIALLFGIAFTAFSGSRGNMLSVILGLAIIAWYLPSWRHKWLRFGAILSTVVLIAAAASFTSVGERTAMFLERATQNGLSIEQFDAARSEIWRCGIQIGGDAAILGQGHDASLEALKSCAQTGANKSRRYSHFHNLFIDQFAKGGMVGLLSASFLLFVPVILMLRWIREGRISKSNPIHRMLIAVGFSFWLMHLVSSLFNIGLGHDAIDSMFVYTASLILGTTFAVASHDLNLVDINSD
ncbi:MAG: O-antigen ligase family protein [Pseudomonadota bacterium]